jgi:hypothetical protein
MGNISPQPPDWPPADGQELRIKDTFILVYRAELNFKFQRELSWRIVIQIVIEPEDAPDGLARPLPTAVIQFYQLPGPRWVNPEIALYKQKLPFLYFSLSSLVCV